MGVAAGGEVEMAAGADVAACWVLALAVGVALAEAAPPESQAIRTSKAAANSPIADLDVFKKGQLWINAQLLEVLPAFLDGSSSGLRFAIH